MSERPTNHLAGQTSPYLLQHAHNPVAWYPWGDEALDRARREDRPLLLSIGYAACHWCHVMERESFEDEITAAFMNAHFVSIKVDREERPDLDAVYMDAVQAMTGQGGWPLTAFCAPDGTPFFTGTYFPKEERYGMPSFLRVLEGVAEAWRDRRDELLGQGARVVEAIGRTGALAPPAGSLSAEVEREALAGLTGAFDPEWGGFGGAPKFPQPMTLEFLLRGHLGGEPNALEMVIRTLDAMANGGIHDQLGGGFARYSTDERWHVPHFEKMLYDNAQLALLYTRAWQVTRFDRYRRVASTTLRYLLREMRHPGGGFFSSQDADSEGVEGKFFTWDHHELVRHAGPEVAAGFGSVPSGNWEGTNVLWLPQPLEVIAAGQGVSESELEDRLAMARRELFEIREARVHPATDDKVLAAWNGLAISAFAEAGRAMREPSFIDAAVGAAEFVLANLRRGDGRLLRSWRDGHSGQPGFADDYALVAGACLTLYETTFELRWFREARDLCHEMLRLFADDGRGGFFQTGSDAEVLVVRPKEIVDNAVPSANSAAADVLLRLAMLTGDERYERSAASALRLVHAPMAEAPTGFGLALCALDRYVSPGREVAIVGDPRADDTRALVDEVTTERFLPNHVLAVTAPGDAASAAEVPLLRDREQIDDRATAYVCELFACKLPVTSAPELAAQLVDPATDRQ